jgi:Sulfotransferase domain
MKTDRTLYYRLPDSARSAIRSLIPDSILRWYAHRKTDVYLISYPKCGRTWLRLMIGKAIVSHYNLPATEDNLFIHWKKRLHPEVPHITVVHEDRPMLKTPDELINTKERYHDKRVIFLARDPRDVVISSFFEMKNRGLLFGENPYETRKPVFDGSLTEFIHRQQGGFETILRYYNIWAENRNVPRDFLLVRYEDLKANPQKSFRRVIDFLGLQCITEQTLAEAVEFASFDNMHRMEQQGIFASRILNPAESDNRNSYKTRKGKVKGFLDYLNPEEIEYLNHQMQEYLSPFYGYTV